MANIYLQHEFSTGKVYEFSKEAKEGFEEHTSTKGKVTYRGYYNKGLYGILKDVSVRDSKFGREISVAMTDKFGNTVYFNLALYDQKDNITDYAQSLIRVLPEPGLPPITVSVFHSKPSVVASLNLGHGVYIDFSSPADLFCIYLRASLNEAYCPFQAFSGLLILLFL